MTWTTPEDIKDVYIGNAILPTDIKLAKLIKVVEDNILNEYPNIQKRLDDPNQPLTEARLKNVIAGWVIEYIQTGGEAITQESQAYTGAASRSVTYSDGKRRTTLLLSAEDLSVLAPASTNKAFSLNMVPNPFNGEERDFGGVFHPSQTWY
jgi:hypothetical protein